ncbi:tRNA(Ile)-lysidine synthetase [Synechocystis sp. LKSZ1]
MAMVWTALHSQLHKTLRQRAILPRQSPVLIAVSGGQDSVCLLQLLVDLRKHWDWPLAIGHCDHGWALDQGIREHVQGLAVRFDLPCYVKVAQDLPETEAAARQWRYQTLIEIAEEHDYNHLVTGHTQSDRAETLLYNLVRGSGSDGLQALTWQRALTPALQLLRPLLGISRRQTGEFCQHLGLPVWEDAYNQSLRYARNRIRQELIPYLQDHFNPQVEKALAQTVEVLQAEVAYLEALADQHYGQAYQPDPPRLERRHLQALPQALQRRVIRRFLQALLPHQPSFDQIEAVTALILAPNRSASPTLPGKWIIVVSGPWLLAQRPG